MKNTQNYYLTDEALEALIASVEENSITHPPKGFKSDIISKVRRRKKYQKNMQLFSYSMKVIVATAAALWIVFTVPENIDVGQDGNRIQTEEDESIDPGNAGKDHERSDRKTKKSYDERIISRINKHMDGYWNIINGKLDSFVRMEVNFDEKKEE